MLCCMFIVTFQENDSRIKTKLIFWHNKVCIYVAFCRSYKGFYLFIPKFSRVSLIFYSLYHLYHLKLLAKSYSAPLVFTINTLLFKTNFIYLLLNTFCLISKNLPFKKCKNKFKPLKVLVTIPECTDTVDINEYHIVNTMK